MEIIHKTSLLKETSEILSLAKMLKNTYYSALEDNEKVSTDDLIMVFDLVISKLESLAELVKNMK